MTTKPSRAPGALPRRHLLALALAATLASGALPAETGTVLRKTELRAEPLGSAQVLAQLAAKAEVEVGERKGAWAAVTTGEGASGWVRVLAIRTGSGERGASGAGSLASVFRTGSSGQTVTTGVKGLSAEQLRNASPDAAELARLDALATNADDARRFAAEANLQPREVEYLTAAKRGRRN